MKEGWKYVMVMCGEQFATTTGVLRMLMLYVTSLVIILQVYKIIHTYTIAKGLSIYVMCIPKLIV